MRLPHALLISVGIGVVAAGCEVVPNSTAPAALNANSPSFDSGVMYGSGNMQANETAADSVGATTADRGGVMYGSGN